MAVMVLAMVSIENRNSDGGTTKDTVNMLCLLLFCLLLLRPISVASFVFFFDTERERRLVVSWRNVGGYGF